MTPFLFNIRRNFQKLKTRIAPKKSDQVYFEDRVEQYRSIWQAIASDIGADFESLDDDIWRIVNGTNIVQCYQYQLSLDNPVTLELAGRKSAVHRLLQADAIPVPEHIVISAHDLESAREFLGKHRNGVVVKPNAGYGGKGVTTHITSHRQLTKAAVSAAVYDSRLLVEEQIYGECFRALVYRGEVLSVVRRSGLRITGDGHSSISELTNTAKSSRLDEDLSFCLSHLGVSQDTVLADGETKLARCVGSTFRPGAELRTIYDTSVTDFVSADVMEKVCRAAELIRSEFAGVDVITSDITVSLEESGGVVNEVNTTPALHHHYDSKNQRYPMAARRIIEDILSSHG